MACVLSIGSTRGYCREPQTWVRIFENLNNKLNFHKKCYCIFSFFFSFRSDVRVWSGEALRAPAHQTVHIAGLTYELTVLPTAILCDACQGLSVRGAMESHCKILSH